MKKKLKEISQINYQYEYNLSEIVFELKTNENINDKYLLIKNKIKQDGFVEVALSSSISETSKQVVPLDGFTEQYWQSYQRELINIKTGNITNL